MAIHRGIQSAIFYYLSCAPCAEARVRRQRKEEAKRDRADRLVLEAEMPHLYRHPSPSSTNPHWQTEIQLGPTLAARGKRRTNTAGTTGAGTGAGRASSSTASRNPSSVDLPPPPGSSASNRNDSKINLRLLPQRQDEELWGSSSSTTNLDGPHSRESLPRRPPRALTKEEATADKTFRNPAINDLHPATVTRVTSRDDVRWMMQPMPVAEVMNGMQAPPSRTGFTPTASPRFGALSDRAAEQSLRLGSSPSKSSLGGLSRESSSRASNRAPPPPPPQFGTGAGAGGGGGSNTLSPGGPPRLDRSNSIAERDFALVAPPRSVAGGSLREQRSPQMSPIADQHLASSPTDARRLSSQHTPRLSPLVRPLSTVVSSENLLPPPNEQFLSADPSISTPTRVPSVKGGALSPAFAPDVHTSLKLAQDLLPSGGTTPLVKTQIVTAAAASPAAASKDIATATDSDPEIFETWQSPEEELPKWILEHTRREGVSERWSMDL